MSGYKTKFIVAAIDIGTTYIRYAYSFKEEYKRDPLKIYVNHNWSDCLSFLTFKAPTVVLFDNKGNFHSFGYDAETKYATLFEVDEHIGWKYFRHFKMNLHERVNLRRNMMLLDDQGNQMPALDVFSEAIKYSKDHLLKRLTDRIKDVRDTDIHWVLTVPAIWHDCAKQLMKEAAAKAGIPRDQLTLSLEPEAAVIYCKELVVSWAKEQKPYLGQRAKLHTFDPGSQFMVLDLGGTVHITVHEVQRDGTLKELHIPSDGPWGGTVFDKEINEYLDELFGKDVMEEFRSEYITDYLSLQRTIESKKRACNDGDDKVNLKLPMAIYEVFEEKTLTSFASTLPRTKFARSVKKKKDKLQIGNKIFLQMFKSSKDGLVNHVENMLRKPELRNVKHIIMVGGFSECEIMKNAVQHAFPTKNIIVPEQPELAVVFGAVMYGHNTDYISSRQIPFTYDDISYEKRDMNSDLHSRKSFGQLIDVHGQIETVLDIKTKLEASKSVCKIIQGNYTATGFRVGSRYIMTASHVTDTLQQGLKFEAATYAVFNYLKDGILEEKNKFYFKEVVYKNPELDISVIELVESRQPFPPPFTNFDVPSLDGFHLIGHSQGHVMGTNPVTKIVNINNPEVKYQLEQLKQLSYEHTRKSFDVPPHNTLDNPHRFLFHCKFTKGGSGSPGFILIDEKIIVTTVLLHGYPDWYYDPSMEIYKMNWLQENCIEQGVKMMSVHEKMMQTNQPLCINIFEQTSRQ